MKKVASGLCARCHFHRLLYPALNLKGERVGICYECRESIKELMRRKK